MPTQSIPIELGGKTRHLRYTFNALMTLEDELEVPLSDIGKVLTGSVSVKTLRTVLWAGLIHEDKELTQEQVGEWADFSVFSQVVDGFTKAFDDAFPDDEGGSKNEKSPKTKQGK